MDLLGTVSSGGLVVVVVVIILEIGETRWRDGCLNSGLALSPNVVNATPGK